MARRRRFHRSAPDRGWVVGQSSVNMTIGVSEMGTQVLTLFDFADIDPEALTGRIEQDKSDWFIKRVILNGFPMASLDGLADHDSARIFTWAAGTIGVENATEADSTNAPIIGAEMYNLWSRLFQTGLCPVYHASLLPYAVDTEAPDGGLLTVPSTSGATPAGWTAAFGWWGPARIKEDFTVSNAGLRNNQVCALAIHCGFGTGPFDWAEGDNLAMDFTYQVLVQKRRT